MILISFTFYNDFFQEEESPKEVQTEFGVKLIKFDDAKKVKLIKEIKAVLTDINLVQVQLFKFIVK